MSFLEARLLDCVAYGTRGGPTFNTRRVPLNSGIVRRTPRRSRPLYRFNVIYQNLQPEHHMEVIHAFNACYGGAYGFRLKDWSDYQATTEALGVATGSSQQIQLKKTYTFGGQSVVRNIRKPVTGKVTVYANGVAQAPVIDYTTGIVTLTATNGHVLTWTGEFDVPVYFEDDELSFSNDNRGEDGLFLNADVGLLEDLSA